MKSLLFAVLMGAALTARAGTASPPPSRLETEGRELVARLLAQRPQESGTNTTALRIRVSRTNHYEVPLVIEVRVTATNWQTVYRTLPGTNSATTHMLIVTRSDGDGIRYELRKETADSTESRELSGAETMTPFAGSDYWVADLGMEFLHWPTQRLLKKELCRGQSCDRLESLAPAGQTNGYTRVVAWFDIDTGGPVLVEAYDAAGRMLKEFKPNKFKKVKGQWQVEEMEISNRKTGSRSWIRFKNDTE
jgi:hypothetical protein